jgi:release factor glutamine methyltransferase
MNNQTWLNSAQSQLEAKGIGSAKIDVSLILAHILGKDRTFLLAHSEDVLTDAQINQAEFLLSRRLKDEPMAFILGTKEFYGLPFKTDSRALIPRGESETVVTLALEWLKNKPQPQIIAEIGTGSGAIIVALAHSYPNHTYIATDISQEALDLAKENAELLVSSEQWGVSSRRQTVSRQKDPIQFLQGDLGEPLLHAGYTGKIDVLVTNLPYIPTSLLQTLDPTITYYEPNVALEGGKTGLELYEQFIPQAKELLSPVGLLLFEHDYYQSQDMRELVTQYFPDTQIKTVKDYLGEDRVLSCNLAKKD